MSRKEVLIGVGFFLAIIIIVALDFFLSPDCHNSGGFSPVNLSCTCLGYEVYYAENNGVYPDGMTASKCIGLELRDN
jgi:hypothetical protein